MNSDQALDVLETIGELYPKYVLTKRKMGILVPQLLRMDYDKVLHKLSCYVAHHAYAPTLADIAAYPPETNTYVDLVSQWKREAAQVSEETKQRFKVEMEQLLKGRGGLNG